MTVSNQPDQPTTTSADTEADAAVSAEAPQAAPAETGAEAPAETSVADGTTTSASEGVDATPAATSSTSEGAVTGEDADSLTPDTQEEAERVASSEGDEPHGPLGLLTKAATRVVEAIADHLPVGGDKAGEAEKSGSAAAPAAAATGEPDGGEPVVAATEDAEVVPAPVAETEPPAGPGAHEPATPEAAEAPESADDTVAPPAPAGAELPPEPIETPEPVETAAPDDSAAEAIVSASETAEPADKPAAATPTAPRPGAPAIPTPAAMPKPSARPATPAAAADAPAVVLPPSTPSNSASFGRVAEDGTVYVRTPDGERAVGSYPGASDEEALGYFARKYDEMWAAAELLYHRVLQTGLSAKEATDDLAKLREHVGEANVVGDLPELDAKIESIATAIEARKQVEATERAAARDQARTEREAIVAEAEKVAAQDPSKIQWKASGARIRELLDEWKQHQRTTVKLDRESENALWQRFSAARNSFDKARRVYFAELEATQSEAKATKERLVEEAEKLSSSKEWGPTAGAYKRLMDQWRKAGRAGRKDDDALWARFKAAQDAFFDAKDAVVAEEEKEFTANLEVKEGLLKEAQALLPIKDLNATKAKLRTIQDKWDAAGKVPRSEMGRIEGELRKVEQAVRDAEDAKWKKSNPEVNHRASAFAEQIEKALEKENKALEKAKASGDAKRIAQAEENLAARRQLLEMVLKAQQ